MKKVIICSVIVCILFSLCSVLCLADSYTIAFNGNGIISIPKVSGSDYYIVYSNLQGTWREFDTFDSSVFGGGSVYNYAINTTYSAEYKVTVYDVEGGDISAQSNTLTYTTLLVNLSFRLDDIFGYTVEWDNVPNVTSYTLQQSYNGSSNWSVVKTFPSYVTIWSVNSDDVNVVLSDNNFFRILAYTPQGVYYSNIVQYKVNAPFEFEPWDTTNVPPLPSDVTAYDFPATIVNTYNQLLFMGIFKTELGSYVFMAFGILTTFCIVGYFVFKMH